MRCSAATIPVDRPRSSPRGWPSAWRVAGVAGGCLLATTAQAGPWARGAGNVFISVTSSAEETLGDIGEALTYGTVEIDPERTTSVYAEIGIAPHLTGAIDLQFGEVSQMSVAFLRYTFTRPDSRWQIALDAGAGNRSVDGGKSGTLARLGASVGWGFGPWSRPLGDETMGHEGGWIALDAHALVETGSTDGDGADPILQGELTFGLNMTDRLAGILAVKAEDWPDAEPVVSLRPSIVFALTGQTSIQAGAHAAVEGSDAVGLSLSIWQEF